MKEPKTVRVRIAVRVEPSGDWHASIWHEDLAEDMKPGDASYWIEADVPLPLAPQVIEGQVVAPAQERRAMSSVRTYGGVDEWSRVYAAKTAEDAAEIDRLRGLLAIARKGLGGAAKDVLDGRSGPRFAFSAYECLRRSDPDATGETER